MWVHFNEIISAFTPMDILIAEAECDWEITGFVTEPVFSLHRMAAVWFPLLNLKYYQVYTTLHSKCGRNALSNYWCLLLSKSVLHLFDCLCRNCINHPTWIFLVMSVHMLFVLLVSELHITCCPWNDLQCVFVVRVRIRIVSGLIVWLSTCWTYQKERLDPVWIVTSIEHALVPTHWVSG